MLGAAAEFNTLGGIGGAFMSELLRGVLVFLILNFGFIFPGRTENSNSISVSEIGRSDIPHIAGSSCDFVYKSEIILIGEWGTNPKTGNCKLWMKINDQIVEFSGKRKPGEERIDTQKKRWKQEFRSANFILLLDLTRTGESEEGCSIEGDISIKGENQIKKLKVEGSCSI
jgi:hypothetical protein